MDHSSVSNPLLTIVVIGILATTFILTFLKGKRRSVGDVYLPPGPTPLPFIGNLLSIDAKEPWKTYSTWAAHYGDFFKIRVLKQDMIVINSEKIAKDLLERRSNIYSDRPYLASREPFGWTFNFAWAPYGEQWRLQRRTFHQAFRAEAAVAYHPVQLRKGRQLVLDMLSTPQNFYKHIHIYSAALTMSIVYDYEVDPVHDPIVEMLEHGSLLAMEGLKPEMSCIIDAFPFLLDLPTWFPGAVISRKAAASKECAVQMVAEPFKYAAKRNAEGSDASAMALDLLKRLKDISDPVRIGSLKDTCTTAYVAGAETTTSTMRWFMLAMLDYPEVQKRAQAEIDTAVGTDRLPNFDDRPNLPYVEAILLEVLRMYVIVPLGVPHSTIADDIYGEFFIPKGDDRMKSEMSAMCHDEKIFQEPNVFKPERFFKDGKLDKTRAVDSIIFGFGRRVCPGRYIAESSVWAPMVLILSIFKISTALDKQGKEICFERDPTTGVVIHPGPFPCAITPRMPDRDTHKLLSAIDDWTESY